MNAKIKKRVKNTIVKARGFVKKYEGYVVGTVIMFTPAIIGAIVGTSIKHKLEKEGINPTEDTNVFNDDDWDVLNSWEGDWSLQRLHTVTNEDIYNELINGEYNKVISLKDQLSKEA